MIKDMYKKYKEIINYLFFGFLTVLVTVVTYLFFANVLFTEKNDLTIQIANVLSWICAVIFAYFTNRIFVFESKTTGKKKYKEFINFVLARVLSLCVDMIMMYVLYSIIHLNDTISKLIVQIVVVIINYILSKLIIFKNVKGT